MILGDDLPYWIVKVDNDVYADSVTATCAILWRFNQDSLDLASGQDQLEDNRLYYDTGAALVELDLSTFICRVRDALYTPFLACM